MKFHIMLAVVYVASAKNLNTNEKNVTEYYIDYNQNSNDTEQIYGSSKFTEAILNSFSKVEKYFQQIIETDVENTTLNNNAEETTKAPPIELYNKTLLNNLNVTDEIGADIDDNKQTVTVPVELKILDKPEYDKNQTRFNCSNNINEIDRKDKEKNIEPPISNSQADVHESNTDIPDRQDEIQSIYSVTVPEYNFKESKEELVKMPVELLKEDASEQVLHKKPDIDAHKIIKNSHFKKIGDNLDSTKPLELHDVNSKNFSGVSNMEKFLIEHFFTQGNKIPNKTDSLDDDNDGKRNVSLEAKHHEPEVPAVEHGSIKVDAEDDGRPVSFDAFKPLQPMPKPPPVEHGSNQFGLECVYSNESAECINDTDDGGRPVSLESFIPQEPLPKPPPVEHGSIQAGLKSTHSKESLGCVNDTDDGIRPVSFDVFKPEHPIPKPPLVEHGSIQAGLNSTTNKLTDKPNVHKQEDSTQKTVTATEESNTRVSSSEVSNTEISTTEVSTTETSTTEVSTAGVSTTETSTTEVSTAGVFTTETSTTETSTAEVSVSEDSSADPYDPLISIVKTLDKKRKAVLTDIETS